MRLALSLAALIVTAVPVLAQHNHGAPASPPAAQNHQHHGAAAPAQASPATQAYMAANDKMHRDMNITFSGDADTDFVRGMVPHHQGAVDMAKIVLQYGKDPEIKKLAEEIIAAQEKEIALFRAWLARKQK